MTSQRVWQFQYCLSWMKSRPPQNVCIMLYHQVFVQKNITQSLLMTLQGTILFIVITVPISLSMHTYEPHKTIPIILPYLWEFYNHLKSTHSGLNFLDGTYTCICIVLFLHTQKRLYVIANHSQGTQQQPYFIQLISWLLMDWHQQPWYWANSKLSASGPEGSTCTFVTKWLYYFQLYDQWGCLNLKVLQA